MNRMETRNNRSVPHFIPLILFILSGSFELFASGASDLHWPSTPVTMHGP